MQNDPLSRDPTLLEAFRSGQRWALETVWDHYEDVVRGVVCGPFGFSRGLRSVADREDAVQAVFLAAFEPRARGRYDGRRPYGAFLAGIARNKVRKMVARSARMADRPEDGSRMPAREPDAEATLLDAERRAVLGRFREGLGSETDRQILVRHFGEGMAERPLARQLGMTRHRLRTRIARLLRRMTRYLEEHGFVD